MKNSQMEFLIQMAVLERTVATLYAKFAEMFPQDQLFWKQLSNEELNHASVVETHMQHLVSSRQLDVLVTDENYESITLINEKLERLLTDIHKTASTRYEALSLALQLEQSAGESHYQNALSSIDESVTTTVFKNLHLADKNHAALIAGYMQTIKADS